MAVLVVDGTGALHLANARARALFVRGNGLRVEHGYLALESDAVTRRLQDAIVRAATGSADAPDEELVVTGDGAATWQLRIRPGERDGDERDALRRVWILVDDDDPQRAATQRLLSELTPRERDVLRLLVRGDGAKEVAWRLGLSAHTVAGYVKALHRRLGVRSRGELLARFIGRGVIDALGGALDDSAAVAMPDARPAPASDPSH